MLMEAIYILYAHICEPYACTISALINLNAPLQINLYLVQYGCTEARSFFSIVQLMPLKSYPVLIISVVLLLQPELKEEQVKLPTHQPYVYHRKPTPAAWQSF